MHQIWHRVLRDYKGCPVSLAVSHVIFINVGVWVFNLSKKDNSYFSWCHRRFAPFWSTRGEYLETVFKVSKWPRYTRDIPNICPQFGAEKWQVGQNVAVGQFVAGKKYLLTNMVSDHWSPIEMSRTYTVPIINQNNFAEKAISLFYLSNTIFLVHSVKRQWISY